jgi:DNA mismatch repair ATPase MutS
MKQSITICLDSEIVMKLKQESNYSNTINEQMKAYYDLVKCKSIAHLDKNLSETMDEIKKFKRKAKEIKENISEIKQKEKATLELFNKNIYSVLSKASVDELIKIQNLDYETALRFCENKNLIKRGIGPLKLIKLWEEIKNVRK